MSKSRYLWQKAPNAAKNNAHLFKEKETYETP